MRVIVETVYNLLITCRSGGLSFDILAITRGWLDVQPTVIEAEASDA